ncbi:MAG TPA: sulfite exporter TauE/SafE family protein [Blastocatellia bacterium]|nr:sulfite exporter TauE/SafE family protein [Blastocatellia bacterium]
MSLTTTVIVAMAILFVSTLIRSAIGFGDALIAMPLLAMAVGIQTATPLVAFAASTIAITVLAGNWRSVDRRSAWRLILVSLAGIPFGLVLLKVAPEVVVKVILGLMLIAYGLYSLFAPRLPVIRNEKSAYVFGFVAGVLGGAYNTNGPPIVMYGLLRRWPPEHFRATLQFYFLFTGLLILASHGIAGLWTWAVLRLYVYSIPAIMLAIWVGGKINSRIPTDLFSRIVYALLVVIGVLFMI